MKRITQVLALLLIFAMVFSLTGCGDTTTNGGSTLFEAGTYTAKAAGMNGDMEIEVIVSDNEIESIKVLDHNETEGIADPAIERIPADIISAQGLNIDAISGATITSNAIIAAVTECLTQAGANVEELKSKGLEEVALSDEVIDTDVVVVGAGIAGLSAAITAAEDGAAVVLLEKMANVGGASIVSGGEILAAGTAMQSSQGIEDSTEALKNYWLEIGEGKINEEIVSFIAKNSGETVNWLEEIGVNFGDVTFSYNYPNQSPYRNHVTEDYSGAGFIMPLYEYAQTLGIDIHLETPVVSLINNNGAIEGVIAENKGRTVTVNAASTILATGGFANNEELMKEYSPNIGSFGTFLGEAHNGDGLIMAREVGAEIVAGGGAIVNPMDLGSTQYNDPGGIFLNVTPEGERFANENEYWFDRNATLYHEKGFNYYYGITDSKIENDGLEEALANKTVFKADTIEELAEMIGIDPAVLTKTVSRYNEMCEAQIDEDFGKPAVGLVGSIEAQLTEENLLNAIDEGPYYAILFPTNYVTGTFGGPKTDINARVISTTGEVIPGLYAAGEVANGELFYQQYPCSGSSIQMSATMGIQAGRAAAAKAQ